MQPNSPLLGEYLTETRSKTPALPLQHVYSCREFSVCKPASPLMKSLMTQVSRRYRIRIIPVHEVAEVDHDRTRKPGNQEFLHKTRRDPTTGE